MYDHTTNPAEMLDRERAGTQGSFSQYQLAGYIDNLQIDRTNRLIALSTIEENLKDNEIIISQSLAKELFPQYQFNTYNQAKESFINIADSEIDLNYSVNNINYTRKVKIVGICNDSGAKYYASNDLYKELYCDKYEQAASITVDLAGKTVKERKALMERLYTLGYSLAPVDVMPGSYLEFVDGKGETYAEVDGEGLKALYPYYKIIEQDGEYYFENDGLILGIAEITMANDGTITSIDKVYMTSTMVKRIALDESYITKNIGNLSLYYLFSEYYTYSNTTTGNYILEVASSMYTFLLGMALVIAIGFIYLKENKEKDTMTKLSMLGVRPRHIYLIHLITYSVIAILIALGSIGLTYIAVNYINSLFTYSFESGAVIHRVRLMFETTAINSSIIISAGIFVLSMISGVIVTFRARK